MYRILQAALFIFSLALISTFISCGDETQELPQVDYGYEYHPIGIGKFWTYKVDSTVITNGGNDRSISSSFVKEEITNSFLNSQGDTTFVLTRSLSDSIDGRFKVADIWKIEKTESNLIRFEENLQFMKLLFPVIVGSEWNGNMFDEQIKVNVAGQSIDQYKGWEYKIISDNVTQEINGTTYEKVVRVEQAMYDTAIELRNSNEWYAPNVGLIKRELEIFNTNPPFQPEGTPWLDKADRGFQLSQILVEHN